MTPLHRIPGTHLAVAARPRGGDWLEDELLSWKRLGIDVVVSLLEPEEAEQLSLEDEATLAKSLGLQFLSFPIADRSVPSLPVFSEFLDQLRALKDAGRYIAIHCRQGVGRAGLTAAALLMLDGIPAADAIETVSLARKITVPETVEQKAWLHAFDQSLQPA